MRTSVDVRFERGDPVREYWLAHGEGFALQTKRGRVVGEVVDVVVDPGNQRVLSLVVRRSVGTTEFPAEEIQAVIPARDAFVLDGAPPREPQPSRRRQPRPPRVRPALRAARREVGPVLAAIWAWLVAFVRWLGATLRVLVVHGRRELGELLQRARQ